MVKGIIVAGVTVVVFCVVAGFCLRDLYKHINK